MILVDIEVPATDSVYDFELDEEIPVKALIEEIVKILMQKEKYIGRAEEKLYLYAYFGECLLCDEKSLKQQGVKTGEKLFLL